MSRSPAYGDSRRGELVSSEAQRTHGSEEVRAALIDEAARMLGELGPLVYWRCNSPGLIAL